MFSILRKNDKIVIFTKIIGKVAKNYYLCPIFTQCIKINYVYTY